MNIPTATATLLRITMKALLLFLAMNLLFALLNPLPLVNRITIYNWLVPGRHRLPYGEDSAAYNLSLNSLDAMFAAHEVVQAKHTDEYRIVIIGDSSVWGILLRPEQTLSAQINAMQLTTDNGHRITAYNLGHPLLSLAKDILILDHAQQYAPDMIIWLTTLQSFRTDEQFTAPLVQSNATHMQTLLQRYVQGQLVREDLPYNQTDLLQQTIIGQRRALSDWLRLQLYGVMWGITGIDQVYPEQIALRTSDFESDLSWESILTPRPLTTDDLAFDIIELGHKIANDTPILLVNEPVYISTGHNSDIRYNLWYPRWAYDAYRDIFHVQAQQSGWYFIDLWDSISADEFTDSPVHLTLTGTQQLAQQLSQSLLNLANGAQPPNG